MGDSVRALVIQPDGRIVIGGLFTNVNNLPYNHIARLNPDGSTDTNFNVGLGLNDSVFALQLDPEGRMLVGGNFIRSGGVTRARLTQLNADGTVDCGINFGAGADAFVSSIVLQDDGNIVVGGGFATFNKVSSPHMVRLFGGTMTGSGKLEFDNNDYLVNENGLSALITIRRINGTFSAASADFVTSAGLSGKSAVAGVDYVNVVTNHVVFLQGETFQTVSLPVIDNFLVDGDRTLQLALCNFFR